MKVCKTLLTFRSVLAIRPLQLVLSMFGEYSVMNKKEMIEVNAFLPRAGLRTGKHVSEW